MAPTARLPPKKDVALALLEQASMYIHLDPRADSVQVPAWFKKQPQLVLQVGLNMAVPIPDLNVDEQGLSCTLSFNRAPFFCMIPWRAVFALVGEKGQAMVWAEDVPAEVAAQAQAQKQPERPRPHLRSVADGESAPPPAAAAPAPALEKPSEAKAAPKKAAKKAGRAVAKEKAPELASKVAKPAAKTKAAPKAKPAAKKGESAKVSAAKKTSAQKPAPKKPPEAQTLPKQAARPKAAVAAKQAEKPALPRANEGSKPKRELPPYLRVVK
jgi:stringent starvation protein B